MSRFDWLSGYLAALQDEHVLVRRGSARELAPAHLLELDVEDWGSAGRVAHKRGLRWAGLWGEAGAAGDADRGTDPRAETEAIRVYACLEYRGDYLVLRTAVPLDAPLLPSHSVYFPAADRPERHTQDMLGVVFTDHPDTRRWTRHQAWGEGEYPLRSEFPLAGNPPPLSPADAGYPFQSVKGAGVYEIPVGPVHAGIIEPGHFRFQAVGEELLRLEQHLGYVHKGIEKLAVGRSPEGLVRLAGRVSGDSTVAHAWAACQALERACGCEPPARAQQLRGLLAERERVANHLGDIGAVCNDVGFAFALYQCSRLREQWQRRSNELFGHRLLMDRLVPGGVRSDLDAAAIRSLRADHADLLQETRRLFDLFDDQPSLEDRLLDTGVLSAKTARELGCTGYVAKASGLGFDVRKDRPYGPYARLPVEVPVQQAGDVMARVQVRMDEVRISLQWMDRLLDSLEDGPNRTELPPLQDDAMGFGLVEGWRGEVLCWLHLEADTRHGCRVLRYFPRDPSWHTWPALERIVLGNIVPDFPVCNKSVNGSYSGHDL